MFDDALWSTVVAGYTWHPYSEETVMRDYTTRTGATQKMQSFKTLERAIHDDDNTGFCLACGQDRGGVEPDARKYPCESCGARKVYGAQELLIMGLCY